MVKDQKILDEAKAWLNLKVVTNPGPYNEYGTNGILISMTRIGQRFYVYEKIIQDKDKPTKGNFFKNEYDLIAEVILPKLG